MFPSDPFLLPPADFSDDLWHILSREVRPIVVYGMGNGGDKLADRLALFGKEIADFFASDGFVRGQSFRGKKVLSLSEIRKKYDDFVILVSFGSHLQEVVSYIYSLEEAHTLYIPDMPLAGDAYFDASFYKAHYREIQDAYELLADDASRRVYAATVWYKLTGKPCYLKASVYAEDEKRLLAFDRLETAVDVGAYRGDTLREWIGAAPQLKEVFALEPDRKNFKKLVDATELLKDGRCITCIHAAAWENDGVLAFSVSGNRNATLVDSKQKTSFKEKCEEVQTAKIDTILQGRSTDFIKYDTEGAEMEALKGSFETIGAHSPYLLVSAYHKSEDLFALLLWIESAFPKKYDFYFRRSNCIPAWELNLIASPREEK